MTTASTDKTEWRYLPGANTRFKIGSPKASLKKQCMECQKRGLAKLRPIRLETSVLEYNGLEWAHLKTGLVCEECAAGYEADATPSEMAKEFVAELTSYLTVVCGYVAGEDSDFEVITDDVLASVVEGILAKLKDDQEVVPGEVPP